MKSKPGKYTALDEWRKENFWAPNLGGQGPVADYLATLDAAALGHLREQVRRAYLDGEPDGPRSYAATAWAVRGLAPS